MPQLLESIEPMRTAAYEAGCGHVIDARQVVYIHHVNGVDTACPKCAEGLPDWPVS